MNEKLLETLKDISNNPSAVVQLYVELFRGNFLSIVQKGNVQEDLNSIKFLIYETQDGKRELPIFTHKDFIIDFPDVDSEIVQLHGESFWQRLLKIIEVENNLVVAVDPGQKHGIRLTVPIINGMLANNAKNNPYSVSRYLHEKIF